MQLRTRIGDRGGPSGSVDPHEALGKALAEIKNDEDLERTPVVSLTSSRAEDDFLKSYNLHANGFITKPIDFQHSCT